MVKKNLIRCLFVVTPLISYSCFSTKTKLTNIQIVEFCEQAHGDAIDNFFKNDHDRNMIVVERNTKFKEGLGLGFFKYCKSNGKQSIAKVLVGERKKVLEFLGFLVAFKENDSVARVAIMGVDRAVRGRRYSHLLLRSAAEYFKKIGCSHLLLSVKSENVAALKSYKRFGFKENFQKDIFNGKPGEEGKHLCLKYSLL